jgi:hypothetical protein
LGRKSDYLFRFGTKRFNVYNRQRGKASVLGYFKGLKRGEKTLWYENGGKYKSLRFCGIRKTREAEERERRCNLGFRPGLRRGAFYGGCAVGAGVWGSVWGFPNPLGNIR